MAWSWDDADRFLSTGRDGLLIMHRFERAQKPLDYANEIAVDISNCGDLGVASSCLSIFCLLIFLKLSSSFWMSFRVNFLNIFSQFDTEEQT